MSTEKVRATGYATRIQREALIIMAAVLLGTAAVIGGTVAKMNYDWSHRNKDPRIGSVPLQKNGDTWKKCDGSTLVYHSEGRNQQTGVSVIADSPECAP